MRRCFWYFSLGLRAAVQLWSRHKFEERGLKVASQMLVVPKPREEACETVTRRLGNGTCFTFGTGRQDESHMSLIRSLYFLEGSFESARKALDRGFDSFEMAAQENPECQTITLSKEDLGSPQLGKGRISITEEFAEQSETNWATSGSITYSTPGSFIAGVDFTLSAEYHKSLVKSTSNAIGQVFDIPSDTSCTPTISRYAIKCKRVPMVFRYFKSSEPGKVYELQQRSKPEILLPINSHSPKFFAAMVGCIDYSASDANKIPN